jgi:hypothetical protein
VTFPDAGWFPAAGATTVRVGGKAFLAKSIVWHVVPRPGQDLTFEVASADGRLAVEIG